MASSDSEQNAVAVTVVVKARMSVVYDAIRSQRQQDPARKLVSSQGNEAVILEEFQGLPIIGSAHCTYKEVESSHKMEYELITSDKFKRFTGCWTLTPVENGKATEVKLSSFLDTGLHIPFARQITNNAVLKDVNRRLKRVKMLAEDNEEHIQRSVASH